MTCNVFGGRLNLTHHEEAGNHIHTCGAEQRLASHPAEF